MGITDKKYLLDTIITAVSEYCYESGDTDFNIKVDIQADYGWCSATEIKE